MWYVCDAHPNEYAHPTDTHADQHADADADGHTDQHPRTADGHTDAYAPKRLSRRFRVE